ncbi:SDR family NAD(P)-dependent oxidoreductase [Aquabacter spiritensis]|uniref:NAD(P)-dependent dehydrogenase (Short-subunit alcohol dehydrogenase family) n=1 Tax=Aquabacter spiritensis TaxID=933073 RepID=A0A4R3M6C8_9HYPH|nr:glucose 1-dehydrogenase [Aquabacter spiritensis]TCT06815.1 NAD(P)-dependent dehydrogenase (short-subunit alcohol dehydrogenase family) [Aquabacter spiritensis]
MAFEMSLSGRTALVTGASSGLGRHFAHRLAAAGAAIVLCARRVAAIEAEAEAIRAAGGQATALVLDVTDAASVQDAVGRAQGWRGGLDILVNNAGIARTKAVLDLTEADWDAVLDTNLKGAFLVAQAVARGMRDRGAGGAIVNVASILGLRVAGQVAPYAVSKAGLIQLTQAMALELARHEIRVNALCPGYTETELNRDFFAGEAGQALVRRVPARRLGQPGDLDGALLLLVSDAGKAITGIALPVDGGHLVSSL